MQASYSGSNRSIKYLFENATEVTVEQILTSGTPIATVSVDGSDVDLYAPAGGGGTTVVANPAGEPTDDLDTVQIGNVIYNIPGSGGGSGGSGEDYECDLLFENDPLPSPTTSGTANVTRNYTLSSSIDDYDAVCVVVYGYYYSDGTTVDGPNQKISQVIFKDDYYGNNYLFDSSFSSYNKRFFFEFLDNTHIKTICTRSDAYEERILYKVYGLKFKSSIDIFNPQIYSDKERVVGTWTDGKPLYQKTWDLGNNVEISNSTLTQTTISASDMETIVNAFGIYSTGVTRYNFMANIGDGYIKLQTDRNNSVASVRYITLQYTKTTDTAGSSHWLSGGVMAVNYTEDEQIIGQYLGKTLYQKTYDLGSAVTINADSWYNTGISSGDMERIIEVSNGQAQTINTWPLGSAIDSGTIRLLNERNNNITLRWFTIQYTKSTDTAGNPMANILATQKELEEIAYHYREHCYTTLSDYYSTEERVVGRWTDGKPIYQKTYITDNVTNSYQIDVSSLNIDKLIDKSGTFRRYRANSYLEQFDSIEWRTESSSLNDYGVTCKYAKSSNLIIFYVGGYSDSVITTYVTIQYTKSTDTPGTGPTPGNLVYLPALYSEEEREVGVWTDGKPIYQKTWDFSSSPIAINGGNQWQTLSGVSTVGMSEIIKAECVDYHGTSFNLYVALDGDNYTHAVVNSQTNITMYLMRLTLSYTKTTDQPGSGRYLPDGQLSHHYSTSEHIVGTWIDGSTIYERTWTGLSINTDTSWHSTGIDVRFANRIIGGTSIDNAGQVITESYAHPGYNDLLARSMFAGNTITTITLQYTKSS